MKERIIPSNEFKEAENQMSPQEKKLSHARSEALDEGRDWGLTGVEHPDRKMRTIRANMTEEQRELADERWHSFLEGEKRGKKEREANMEKYKEERKNFLSIMTKNLTPKEWTELCELSGKWEGDPEFRHRGDRKPEENEQYFIYKRMQELKNKAYEENRKRS